jgi:hypothetical protein
MTDHSVPQSGLFIFSAFDREPWSSVPETRFDVADIEVPRRVLGTEANDDPGFWHRSYWREPDKLAAVLTTFGVGFVRTADLRKCVNMVPSQYLYMQRKAGLNEPGIQPLLRELRAFVVSQSCVSTDTDTSV